MMASEGPSPKRRKGSMLRRMAGDVLGDLGVRQEQPRFLAEGRVADLRRAAAEQRHRPVAVLLQQPQHHDLHHAADMQAAGCRIEADIAADGAGQKRLVQRRLIRALEDEAARLRFRQETAFRHRACP